MGVGGGVTRKIEKLITFTVKLKEAGGDTSRGRTSKADLKNIIINPPTRPCYQYFFNEGEAVPSSGYFLQMYQLYFIYSKHASLPRDAHYCCLSCRADKISWVMLGPLAYGQLYQNNQTYVVATPRFG